MQSEIPDKLYFKIGEVSKLAGVVPHVLRYWESEFDAIKPRRTNANQRMYKRDDVDLILTIKTLLHDQGYTISGARHYLAAHKNKQDTVTVSTDQKKIGAKLSFIKSELVQLQAILQKKR